MAKSREQLLAELKKSEEDGTELVADPLVVTEQKNKKITVGYLKQVCEACSDHSLANKFKKITNLPETSNNDEIIIEVCVLEAMLSGKKVETETRTEGGVSIRTNKVGDQPDADPTKTVTSGGTGGSGIGGTGGSGSGSSGSGSGTSGKQGSGT